MQIIELLKTSTFSEKQIGEQFGVSRSAIANINHRKNWKHLSVEFNDNIRKEYSKNY
jgi:predicted XRE-type DNA-binding protein